VHSSKFLAFINTSTLTKKGEKEKENLEKKKGEGLKAKIPLAL